ncbi:MAG: zinc ribbon domain-containing protein [Deltaproteobacteria bacterium]|nr:zinc ribbon domain-containing protein [Deltaproteobacteria bacterium]
MPIFEFRCVKCGNIFEKLFMKSEEEVEISCPECKSREFERVVSSSNYAMGPGGNKTKVTAKSCGPSNQCMTFDIPGPTR